MANGQGSGESRQGLSTQLLHRPFKMEPGSNETWKKRSLLLFHELSLHVKPRWRNWKDFIWKNFPIYGSVCSDACHKRAIWGMLDGKFPSNIPQIPLEMICLLETKLVASSSFPAISFIGRGLSEETWRDMQQHVGVSNAINLKHRVKTAQSVTFPSTSSFTIICRNCVDVKEAVSQSSGPGAVNWS